MTEIEKAQYLFGYETIEDAVADCEKTSQTEALMRMVKGENVFLSGLAGTGKTHVISQFIDIMKPKKRIAITASTGIAATILGGSTIHSWAGLGISEEPFDPNSKTFKLHYPYFKKSLKRIRYTDVLIIDEISMIKPILLNNVNKACQHAKQNDKPFGGIQVIVVGDFLQLPPVSRGVANTENLFVWGCEAWKEANFKACFLDKIFRAKDPRLQMLLNNIVKGEREEALSLVEELSHNQEDDEKVYTNLYTTNRSVDGYNLSQQNNLDTPLVRFRTHVKVNAKYLDRSKVLKKLGLPEEVSLRKGDIVMITDNAVGVSNGTLGQIVSLPRGGDPRVKLNNGKVITVEPVGRKLEEIKGMSAFTLADVSYMPLKLGYAITVHKSQGQTFDGIRVDLSNCFTPGLGYVAISRARAFSDISLLGFNEKALDVSNRAQQITQELFAQSEKNREEFMSKKDSYVDAWNRKTKKNSFSKTKQIRL